MIRSSRLPQYSDDEVRVFHPFFELAINEVISELELGDELEVIHHWTTRGFSGIIDFAICNKASMKVLLPIEVKKTPEDLISIGRKQSRGYLESLGIFRGSDYYLATNLESVELFRESSDRVLTVAQLLNLSLSNVGNLQLDSKEVFFSKLKASLRQVLETVKANDGTSYASNISGLLHALQTSLNDKDSWHQALSFYVFDYIRGALQDHQRFGPTVSLWGPASSYFSNHEELNRLASQIGLKTLFCNNRKGRFNLDEIAQICAGAFESGKSLDRGEELSSVINEITSYLGIPGVVETSQPLANLLAAHALLALKEPVAQGKLVFEPGGGTAGLTVSLKRFLPELKANQVHVLEQLHYFDEVLNLRVGLHFLDSLDKNTSPKITINALENMDQKHFEKVGLVLMNPPFIRGIDCSAERSALGEAIRRITKCTSKLTGEQLGYECGFLELVVSLVPEGTVIASIFPKNALTRPDSRSLREYLLHEFGLQQVVFYNDRNLFGTIQKSTIIIVGIKGIPQDSVDVFNMNSNLEDFVIDPMMDFSTKVRAFTAESEQTTFLKSDLLSLTSQGWKTIFQNSKETFDRIMQHIQKSCNLGPIRNYVSLFRGTIGNQGASELLFNPQISCANSISNPPQKWQTIPKGWIKPAAKNSDFLPREIKQTNGESGIFPTTPKSDSSTELANHNSILQTFLVESINQEKNSANVGKQRKEPKSVKDLQKILEISRPTSGHFVLVPRAQRAAGQIGINGCKEVLVSTNFFILPCNTRRDSIVLGSWLLSLFGQLQLEYLGIDQEGMRKLEKKQIEECLIPSSINLDEAEYLTLENLFLSSEPLNFRQIKIREIDVFWAKKIYPHSEQLNLNQLEETMQIFCDHRLDPSS